MCNRRNHGGASGWRLAPRDPGLTAPLHGDRSFGLWFSIRLDPPPAPAFPALKEETLSLSASRFILGYSAVRFMTFPCTFPVTWESYRWAL